MQSKLFRKLLVYLMGLVIGRYWNSTKLPWIDLDPSQCANSMTIPTGIDKNNYIAMDTDAIYIRLGDENLILLPNLKWYRTAMCLTMAINNKYMVLFGNKNKSIDDIYIYSVKHKTVKLSKTKCPSKGIFNAITINNDINDEKIVFGYVRNEWKKY
eukprot:420526_1